MKIKKIIERLIIFFVGAPLVLASIYLLPHYNFLVYHIELFISALIANYEIYNILSQRSPAYPKKILAFRYNFSSCFIPNGLTCRTVSIYLHCIRMRNRRNDVYGNYIFIVGEFYK